MTTEGRVRIENEGAVRVITLDRAAKKNAFDVPLAKALWDALEAAQADADVRVICVTGEGDYFTGGADLNIFLNIASLDPTDVVKVAKLYDPLRRCTKPTIAIVQGHAVGMGVTILPHFDLVYAADHATFMTPFVKLGLVLEYGSSYTLSRLIGVQRAKELILRAAPIDARTAADWGLVTRVFAAAELRGQALAIAADLAAIPPGAIAESKRLIDDGLDAKSLGAASDAEDAALMKRYGSPENVQAIMQMMERKRR
jgi:enoyl-CoA hydratase/carnithine racemase